MCVCVCVCVCAAVYVFVVCAYGGRSTWQMQHFQHVIQNLKLSAVSGVYNMCLRYCVRVFACGCSLCHVCAWQKHDMIRAALETSNLKREILFHACFMWSLIIIIVIWTLFRKMPANQKPLNRIGKFWYHFTPRKIPYLMVSVNLVTFGLHGLSVWVFSLPPCIGLEGKQP